MLHRLASLAVTASVSLLTIVASASAADVHDYPIVDAGFVTLTNVVSAASPGDIVLIAAGSHVPIGGLAPDVLITITKPLTLVGDGSGATIGMIRVKDLAAGQTVVLRNLTMLQGPLSTINLPTVMVENCAGTVIIEDCTLVGRQAVFDGMPGTPGLVVSNSAGVSVSHSTILGGKGLSTSFPFGGFSGPGGMAASVQNAKLALHHVLVNGGDGGDDTLYANGSKPGGVALSIIESKVFLAGTTLAGGDGSDGSSPAAAATAAGGAGLVQSGESSLLRMLDSTITGGEGGLLTDASNGPAGADTQILAGLVDAFPDSARDLTIDATLREGESATLTLHGPPGELGKFMFSLGSTYAQLSGKKGVWTLTSPSLGPFVIGAFPPSGELSAQLPLALGSLAGIEGLVLSVQGFSFGSEGLLLTNPSEVVLLDADF